MKKTLAMLLALVMVLSLCGCGKSENVKAVEAAIEAIGEVSLDSEDVIVSAENLFEQLTAEEQEKVENRILLTQAREAYAQAVLDAIPTKEEMLEQAQPLDVDKLYAAYCDNKLAAEDTYLNKVFTFDAIVSSVSEDGCTLYLNEHKQGKSVSSRDYNPSFNVSLPREELVTLNKKDVLSIVAILSDFEVRKETLDFGGYAIYLDMQFENAVCLENHGTYVVEWVGEIHSRNTKIDTIDGVYPYNIQLDNDPYLFLVYFKNDANMDEYRWKTVKLVGEPVAGDGGRYKLVNAELVEVLD